MTESTKDNKHATEHKPVELPCQAAGHEHAQEHKCCPSHEHEHGHSHNHSHSHSHGHSHSHEHENGTLSHGLVYAQLAVSAILLLCLIVCEGFWQQYPLARLAVAVMAYLVVGWEVLRGAAIAVKERELFDENTLMVIATLGAFFLQAYSEAVGVMLFFKIGEFCQDIAVERSRRSVRSLLAARPEHANLVTESGLKSVGPQEVKIGETILVKPGEKIPLDGEVLTGQSWLDTSALSGESVPVRAEVADMVLAGSINGEGALEIKVSRPFAESSIARVLQLVEEAAERKANTQRFITSFAHYYTPAVVGLALIIALLPPLLLSNQTFSDWIYRALVILMISCPCALVVSIPLGYFAGIGRASREGILIKGAAFIDSLAQIEAVVFDKTGTLTKGVFTVRSVVTENDSTEQRVLELAAAAETYSNHPIATSIIDDLSKRGLSIETESISAHSVLSGEGVQAHYQGQHVMVGNDALLHNRDIAHSRCNYDGTEVHVVADNLYMGAIVIDDELKPQARQTISELKRLGIKHIEMLTGDNDVAAAVVAKALQIDHHSAGLLPEGKVDKFEELLQQQKPGAKVAFVGDGINDSPVLARADVGIAMGALGSQAAIETADVVLMADSPYKIVTAIQIARKTRSIVWQNIILAIAVKVVFLALGALGIANMWGAVFADVGTTLLATFNSIRALRA